MLLFCYMQLAPDGLSMTVETSDGQKIDARFPRPSVSHNNKCTLRKGVVDVLLVSGTNGILFR